MGDFLRRALEYEEVIEHGISSVAKMEVLVDAVPMNTPRQTDAKGETN